jgi:thioredoxin 1
MAKNTTDNSFNSEVINSEVPVLVDFWAPWCGPCKQLSPLIDELSQDMADKITVYKCNIDDNPETPSKYGVRGIPTLMIFKGGKLVDSKVGSLPKSALYEWVRGNV